MNHLGQQKLLRMEDDCLVSHGFPLCLTFSLPTLSATTPSQPPVTNELCSPKVKEVVFGTKRMRGILPGRRKRVCKDPDA